MLSSFKPSISVTALLLLCLAGCSPVEKDDIPGKYVLNDAGVYQELVLNTDGTSYHLVEMPNGDAYSTAGTWKYYNISGTTRLGIDNFVNSGLCNPTVDFEGNNIKPIGTIGELNPEIRGSFGSISIFWCADHSTEFVKIE